MFTVSRRVGMLLPHVWLGGMSKDGGSHLPLRPSRSPLSRRLPELLLKLTWSASWLPRSNTTSRKSPKPPTTSFMATYGVFQKWTGSRPRRQHPSLTLGGGRLFGCRPGSGL